MNLFDRLINQAHDWLDSIQPNDRRPPHRRMPPREFLGSIYVPMEDYAMSLDAGINPYDNPIFCVPTRREFLLYMREQREAREDARVAARAAARQSVKSVTPSPLSRLSDELWGA